MAASARSFEGFVDPFGGIMTRASPIKRRPGSR